MISKNRLIVKDKGKSLAKAPDLSYNVTKYDIDCTTPYKEGAELDAGTSYIRVKVIIADAYRDQYRDSAGVGTLVLEI